MSVLLSLLTCAALVLASAQGAPGAMQYPVDLVITGADLVVADFKAHGLFRVAPDGTASAIVIGEGLPRTPLYAPRAVAKAPDGNGWLVADPGTSGLYRVGDHGTLSLLTTDVDVPQGLVAFDDRSVLVSDLRSGIGAILRVTLDGAVTVFAEVSAPKGIVADGADSFVFVSHGERALRRLSRDGRLTTIASGAPFDFPHDVVRLADGSFVVSDGYARALFRVSASGEVSKLAQGAPLVNPQGIAVFPDGDLIVVDPQAGAIFRVSEQGEVATLLSVGR